MGGGCTQKVMRFKNVGPPHKCGTLHPLHWPAFLPGNCLAQVICLHGLPERIVSDCGAQFISCFWREVLWLLVIWSSLSSTYHPQSKSQAKRTNQILEQKLCYYINCHQDDWSSILLTLALTFALISDSGSDLQFLAPALTMKPDHHCSDHWVCQAISLSTTLKSQVASAIFLFCFPLSKFVD